MSSTAPQPIPGRARSASLYSLSSLPGLSNSPSVSPNSPTLPQLSPSLAGKSLTQIFSGPQSPLKTTSAFKSEGPGFIGMKPGVVEEDEDDHSHDDFHGEFPASPPRSHTRHTSIGSWGRPGDMDRGQGLLRRLSLGSAFAPRVAGGCELFPPQIHQPTPAPRDNPVLRKPSPLRGNGNSLGLQVQDPIKQRSISPMGERMLKGHFDGFGM
ncbi:hypothetical protein RHS01_07031 [Rhizoctonia solani]|uniref:Uncharacterized protein n=1 Tax=Rhizoctonia solani TaxID=456999 RepID=A0A8H7M344_9AGAM|nr:hypothetical protein RHS01_07031 [Rhizoctonia solani]